MSDFRTDDEIVMLLKDAFPTQLVEPDEEARSLLRDALAHDNLVPLLAVQSRDARRRRHFGSHASALTLSTISVLAFGGVAAAAVVTNTLPGPTRALAYDLGLPVTSPALFQARQQLHRLDSALTHHHTNVVRHLGHGLLRDLTQLDRGDLSQIRAPAQTALTQSGLLQQATQILGITTSSTATTVPPSTATSTTTTTTTPLLPPTLPAVGSLPGTSSSTNVGGTLKNTTSTLNSLLP